jgi:predicted membrane channel-forming protein YqfA (hemolysin III family)
MAAYIVDLGAIVTAIFGYFTTVLGYFVSEPVLALGIGIFLVGAIIGLVMRLFHR